MIRAGLPISVVMPVFNDERFIAQALTSLNSGKARPAEIILVDNASTDRSVEIAEGLGFDNLKVLRNLDNVGATRARDEAINAASQPFITALDSDDWLSVDALQAGFERLQATDSDISLFRMIKMDAAGAGELFALEPPRDPISGHEALALTLGEWRINASGVYRKSVFTAAREQFVPHGFSDDELLTRTCFAAAVRVTGNDGVYFYRTNPKHYNFDKVVGQTITNIRSTALAAERLGPAHAGTRAMRDVVVRNLAGLTARVLRGEGGLKRVASLRRDYAALAIPWRWDDRRARLLDLALKPLLAPR